MTQARAPLTANLGRIVLRVVLALMLLSGAVAPPATDSDSARAADLAFDDFAPGEVLVRLEEGVPATSLTSGPTGHELTVKWHLPRFGIYVLTVPVGRELETAAALRADPAVEYAAVSQRVYVPEPKVAPVLPAPARGVRDAEKVTPNDPFYADWQWNLDNRGQQAGRPDADMDAPEAWEITTGAPDITIAVLDSGIDHRHPELVGKLWTNPDEICDNGLDDDGNRKADDCYGWDYIEWDNVPQNDPGGLGTAVAGVAAAATNNAEGIAGVSWDSRIMPLKVVQNREGSVTDVILGIDYAVDKGARVINMSFVTFRDDPIFQWAIEVAHEQFGVLFTAMAGDCGTGCVIRGKEYRNPVFYPAAFDYVIAVGASNQRDERVALSEWGYFLDVMAPGQGILTPWCWEPTCSEPLPYALLTSTVVAAPHVAGLAALIWSIYPDLTPGQVENVIETSADKIGATAYDVSGRNDVFGYGRISGDPVVLEPPRLTFLVDDDTAPPCRPVANRGISTFTWQAITTMAWLQIEGPDSQIPSSIQVCVVPENLPTYGSHTTNITATSTLSTTMSNPRLLPVTVSYQPSLSRTVIPYIFKSYSSAPSPPSTSSSP